MKRILSVLLCMVMAVAALTGCSTSELEYFGIVNDVYSWDAVSEKGTVEVDLTGLYSAVYNYNSHKSENVLQSDLESTKAITKVKYDYDISMSKSQKAMKIDSDLIISDTKIPIDLSINGNTIAVSKDTIVGVKDFIVNSGIADMETKEVFDFLITYCGDAKNLNFTIPVDEEIKMATSVYDSYAEILDIVEEFGRTAFKDFDTGLLSGTLSKGGIKYEVTIDKVELMLKNGVKYIAEHRDDFIKAAKVAVNRTIDMLRPIMIQYEEEMGMTVDEAIAEMNEEIGDAFPTSEELMSFYDELVALKSDADYLEMKSLFEGSNIVATITMPSSGTYVQKTTADIKYNGKSMVKVVASDEMFGKDVDFTIDATGKELNIDTIDKEWNKYIAKKYPAKKAVITYTDIDMHSATLEIVRDNMPVDETFSSDFDYVSLVNEDDRIYVPMRALAKGLGYEVEWDADAHKAYVIDGANKVDMSGMIVDDRTFIKVRDFEKLGLTVDWTPEQNGYCTNYIATISK